MWDPCGIRMDFNGILLGIKWDPCGIPMDLKGTLLGIKWDPWGTHMGGILFLRGVLTRYSQGSPIEMQEPPQLLFGRALELLKPILQGGTSLFPAKREVKREVGKAWQAWPGNQTS